MQVAALTQVQHGHLEMMKQLEKREARLHKEQQLLNDRTRVLAEREHMLARTLRSATQQYAMYSTLRAMMIPSVVCFIHDLCYVDATFKSLMMFNWARGKHVISG